MPRHIPRLYKHTQLIEKEVVGVIDHADLSVTDGKLASGVGLLDTQICKLPVAAVDKVLKRGAKEWEAGDAAGGIANAKIGWAVRAEPWSGTQSITGVGFKPKIVIFLARTIGGTYQIHSIGFDDGTNHYCQFMRGDSVDVDNVTEQSILVVVDETHWGMGHISSMDDDGFTVTWEFTMEYAIDFTYLAMK